MSDVGTFTLVEFLTAMVDLDERAAKAWLPLGNPTAAERDHIARHDPARVLREVEAKRRIIELHADGEDHECEPRFGEMDWTTSRQFLLPCPTLRALALPYADHPDYRTEWKP